MLSIHVFVLSLFSQFPIWTSARCKFQDQNQQQPNQTSTLGDQSNQGKIRDYKNLIE
jgi:hypothetical protein